MSKLKAFINNFLVTMDIITLKKLIVVVQGVWLHCIGACNKSYQQSSNRPVCEKRNTSCHFSVKNVVLNRC